MEFADMENPENESICALESTLRDGIWEINWAYPLVYDKVVLFKVPVGEAFSEKKAAAGDYEYAAVQSPVSVWTGNRREDFSYVLFPCDSSEQLLFRQEHNRADPPICVRYCVMQAGGEEPAKGFRLFKKAKKAEPYMVLRIQSDRDLEQSAVTYRVPGARASFTLPQGPKRGKVAEYRLKSSVTLASDEPNIILQPVERL